MLQQNDITLCPTVAYIADHPHKMAQRVQGVLGPGIEGYLYSLSLDSGNIVGPNVETGEAIVSGLELEHFPAIG